MKSRIQVSLKTEGNTTVVLEDSMVRSARHKRFLMQLVAVLALSPAVWGRQKPAVEAGKQCLVGGGFGQPS